MAQILEVSKLGLGIHKDHNCKYLEMLKIGYPLMQPLPKTKDEIEIKQARVGEQGGRLA